MNKYWELKRNDNAEIIQLPQDAQWLDEFDWSKLAQSSPVYTVGGSMFVHQGKKKAGRPITIGGDDRTFWMRLGDVKTLRDWAEVKELTMTLTHYNTDTYKVMFRNHDKPIDCKPLMYETPETDESMYTGQIKLMTTE